MTTVELGFRNNDQSEIDFSLKWTVKNTPSAKIWLTYLSKWLSLKENFLYRPIGFLETKRDINFLVKNLNRTIEYINENCDHEITQRVGVEYDRDILNQIHHHFEIIMGAGIEKSDFFNGLSIYMKYSIQCLNYYVHEIESYHKSLDLATKQKGLANAAICMEYIDVKKRVSIPDYCDQDFSLDLNFGDMCLHYSQVGKTLWEIFLDQDEEIFDEAVLETKYISGEFDIFLGELPGLEKTKEEFFKFLIKNNFDPNNESLRLGYNVVATIKNPFKTKEELQKKIASYDGIGSIKIIKDEELLNSSTFKDLINTETVHKYY